MANLYIFNLIIVLQELLLSCQSKTKLTHRILAGKPADKSLWPFIAAVSTGQIQHCGGSLIKPNWVLTAAHCVTGKSIKMQIICFGEINVRINANDLKYKKLKDFILPECPEKIAASIRQKNINACTIPEEEELINVSKIYLNTKLVMVKIGESDLIARDIALLKLSKSIDNASPIKLPTKLVFETKSCLTAGWGKRFTQIGHYPEENEINDLHQITVIPVNRNDCFKIFKYLIPSIVNQSLQNQILTFMFCVKGQTRHQAPFSGDSGGPLVCDNELQGITSLHAENNDDHIGVFTETVCYIDWINKIFIQNGEEIIVRKSLSDKCFSAVKSLRFDKLCVFIILIVYMHF